LLLVLAAALFVSVAIFGTEHHGATAPPPERPPSSGSSAAWVVPLIAASAEQKLETRKALFRKLSDNHPPELKHEGESDGGAGE
jgi:hypothetical protein